MAQKSWCRKTQFVVRWCYNSAITIITCSPESLKLMLVRFHKGYILLVCMHSGNLVTHQFLIDWCARPETLRFYNILADLNSISSTVYVLTRQLCQTEAGAKSVWFNETWCTISQTRVVAKFNSVLSQIYDALDCVGAFASRGSCSLCSLLDLLAFIVYIHSRKKSRR